MKTDNKFSVVKNYIVPVFLVWLQVSENVFQTDTNSETIWECLGDTMIPDW